LQEYKDDKKEPEKPKATVGSTQSKPIYSYKKEKKPINKGLVWSIAIGVPLAAIFVWALLNFNTVQKVFKTDKAKTEKVTQKKKATTKKTEEQKQVASQTADKPNQEAQKKTQETTAKKQPVQPQKKYYIIAGSFKNEKYANAFLNKLKAEGYNAEKLEERNGMHAVSYNSFTDKRKAIAEYKFLAQEKGLQAWILYY
jgi:cell division septation protein DedD